VVHRTAHALAHRPVRSPRRLPRTVLFAPRDATRLAPCAAPALPADAAVLLALLVAVHDGRRRPAHALAHRSVGLLVAVHNGRRRPAHALARPHRHPASARPSPAELSSECPRSHCSSVIVIHVYMHRRRTSPSAPSSDAAHVSVHDGRRRPAHALAQWNPVEWRTYSNCSPRCRCHGPGVASLARLGDVLDQPGVEQVDPVPQSR
jgi:hypothetical protein